MLLELNLGKFINCHARDDALLVLEYDDVMARWLPAQHVQLDVQEEVASVEIRLTRVRRMACCERGVAVLIR